MINLASLDAFPSVSVFVVESPIDSPRVEEEFLARLGPTVVIDGTRYRPAGVSWRVPATPVHAGEAIALRVEADD